jgi:hypothetical protein
MKSWVINILLLVSVAAAVYFFTVKFDKPTDEDKLKAGLLGMQPYLSPGSHIMFRSDAPDAALNMIYTNYFLAPAHFDPKACSTCDTIFLLLQLNSKDSASLALMRGAPVLWQNKDDRFQYILIRHS